ncbi:MAG: SDR family oxidoreductase [Actinomycetia bacterium]|nr:SDR family oxidoreductase [Actinomycetes bacterium]MCP4961758.1 SDR family oxidoreductase [Actinomycetes bacterium]
MELVDRVTVVTGGGSGIGRESAKAFAAEGARAVVVADLNEENAKRVASDIGPVARGVRLDVSDRDAVFALCRDVEDEHGPIDVFFSNAGYGQPGGLDLSAEDWQHMMDVHFTSHLYVAQALVPGMVARGEGYLFSTASAAGLLTQIDSGPYAVSKAAAVAFAEWLAINYGGDGVRVSVLCPQAVRTNIIGDDLTEWDRGNQASQDGVLLPEQVAQMVVETIREERFLLLPHEQVATYMKRKAEDPDRWIGGMQRLKKRLGG